MSDKIYLLNSPIYEIQLGIAPKQEYSRKEALALIYRHTHKDYKNPRDKSILVNGGGMGTMSVPIDALTDAQVEDKLPYAAKKEQARLAKVKHVQA